MEPIRLSETHTYQIDGVVYSFAELHRALQRDAKEQERNRKKANEYYQRKKANLPVKPDLSDLPVKPDLFDLPVKPDLSDLPVKPDLSDLPVKAEPIRTDHRGRIFHSSDENGRITSWNGRPWVPISIPSVCS